MSIFIGEQNVMNRNIMNSAITVICLGIALSITNVWAVVEFDCIEVADNAGDNVDFDCIPRENDVHFKSSDIIDLKLNMGNGEHEITIALDYPDFEDRGQYCLSTPSVNLNKLEEKGTSVIVACDWNQKEKSVIVPLGDDIQLRRRVATARCWSRRSFSSSRWRCRWRSWDCEPIDIDLEENYGYY